MRTHAPRSAAPSGHSVRSKEKVQPRSRASWHLVGDPGGLIGADAHVPLIGRRHDDDLAGRLAEKALGELTGHRGAVDGLAAVALA